jgi:hypothetical protein
LGTEKRKAQLVSSSIKIIFCFFFIMGQSWGTKIRQKKKIGKHNSTQQWQCWGAQNEKVRRKKNYKKAQSQRKKNRQRKKKWESKNVLKISKSLGRAYNVKKFSLLCFLFPEIIHFNGVFVLFVDTPFSPGNVGEMIVCWRVERR